MAKRPVFKSLLAILAPSASPVSCIQKVEFRPFNEPAARFNCLIFVVPRESNPYFVGKCACTLNSANMSLLNRNTGVFPKEIPSL